MKFGNPIAVRSWLLLTLGAALVFTGCNRSFYRQRADVDAAYLLKEHSQDPRWELQQYGVYVDPRSRMYDPFSKDCPPMPPDDPTSHGYMHCVDDKKGWPFWHCNGDTPYVENPEWLGYLPLNERGELELEPAGAVEVGRMNSRTYQTQIEELYLSALDVSFERFRFDSQFFAGYDATYTADGPQRDGGTESSSRLSASNQFGGQNWEMRKLFATGSELVVSFANEIVWEFSGPDTQSANTLLSFTFLQPLLREAGRDRVLERLTLSERTLLANVRQMERYRHGFYLEVTTGRSAGSGPSRRGGLGNDFDVSFTGVGRSSDVGDSNSAAAAGAGSAGGFLGLVQDQQEIRNQESNIASLRSSLAQLEAFFQAGRIDYFQVELARQALYNAQSRLLTARTGYSTSLDNYKIRLGLPPQLPVRVKDDIAAEFNLIDPAVRRLQEQISQLQESTTAISRTHVEALQGRRNEAEATQNSPRLAWNDDLARFVREMRAQVPLVEEVRAQAASEVLKIVRDDVARLRAAVPIRQEELKRLGEKYARLRSTAVKGDPEALAPYVDASLFDGNRIAELADFLAEAIVELEKRLEERRRDLEDVDKTLAALPARAATLTPEALYDELRTHVLFGRPRLPATKEKPEEPAIPALPGVISDLSSHLLALSVVEAEARAEVVTLKRVEIDPRNALEVARENRLDWMNARAALVDSWRAIEFTADALESALDIVFSGDVQNTGPNPLSLNSKTGRLQVGVQFDAPLTRLTERNTYRESLIAYQRSRRNYYAFEDGIARALRDILRNVELDQINFELRRAAVHVAARQVDFATLRLAEPPKPNETKEFGATTARDLVSALSDLLDAQNTFLSVWVNYEVLRRTLDFDLGTMQLDERGVWVDPGEMVGDAADTTGENCDPLAPEPEGATLPATKAAQSEVRETATVKVIAAGSAESESGRNPVRQAGFIGEGESAAEFNGPKRQLPASGTLPAPDLQLRR